MSFVSDVASLIFKQKFSQKVGRLDIDIVSSRAVSETLTITNNPVENGFVSDHVKKEPTEINMSGIISKYSLRNSIITSVTSLITNSLPNRLKDAHDELYRLFYEQEPITLVLKYKSYSNMVLTNLDMPEDPLDGETFRFNLNFKEVRIVQSQLVSLENSKIKDDTAKQKTSYARQTTSPTSTPTADTTPTTDQSTITLTQFIKSVF